MTDTNISIAQKQPEAPAEHPRAWATPPLDLFESEQGYLVLADLPGIRREELKVEVDDDRLNIIAERRGADDLMGEWAVDYRRSVSLPSAIELGSISAKLEHGTLRIELPKAPEVKPRQITIEVG